MLHIIDYSINFLDLINYKIITIKTFLHMAWLKI